MPTALAMSRIVVPVYPYWLKSRMDLSRISSRGCIEICAALDFIRLLPHWEWLLARSYRGATPNTNKRLCMTTRRGAQAGPQKLISGHVRTVDLKPVSRQQVAEDNRCRGSDIPAVIQHSPQ